MYSEVGVFGTTVIGETGEELLIPGLVFDEVVTVGKQKGDADSFIIEECIKRGTIKIADPASKFTGFESEIHAAEMDVMALAGEYGCIAIIDDGIAREIGEMCNVNVPWRQEWLGFFSGISRLLPHAPLHPK